MTTSIPLRIFCALNVNRYTRVLIIAHIFEKCNRKSKLIALKGKLIALKSKLIALKYFNYLLFSETTLFKYVFVSEKIFVNL